MIRLHISGQNRKYSNLRPLINFLDVGVAGDFLSEVKPQSDGSNSIKYNLTPEMVKIIFRTYPEIKAKFLEVCPTEMSERDFWAKFFQSQYFHRDRLPNAKVNLIISEHSRCRDSKFKMKHH